MTTIRPHRTLDHQPTVSLQPLANVPLTVLSFNEPIEDMLTVRELRDLRQLAAGGADARSALPAGHGGRAAAASLRPVVLGAALAVVATGCSSPGPAARVAPDTAPTITDQIRAVREGRADRIEAAERLSTDDWEHLRGLTRLRECLLRAGVAGDAEAAILAKLPHLERLVLRESPLSDAGLAELADCRSLRDLNLPQAACTAAGVEALTALPELRRLRLGGPNLTGPEVARAVARLPKLESLHLIDVAIGDDGLAALLGLARLRNLYLDGAGVSNAAWERYCVARPGVHVHVDQAHHDRDVHRGHE